MRYCIKSLLFLLILSLLSCELANEAGGSLANSQEALNLPSPSISEAKSKAKAKLKEVADSLREAGISGTGPKAIEAAFKLVVEGVDKKTTTAVKLRTVANAAAEAADAAAKVADEAKEAAIAAIKAAAARADGEVIEAVAFAVAGIALLTDSVILAAEAASFSVVVAVVALVAETLAAVEGVVRMDDKFEAAQAVLKDTEAKFRDAREKDSEYFSPVLREAAEEALKRAADKIVKVEVTFRATNVGNFNFGEDTEEARAAIKDAVETAKKELRRAADTLKNAGMSDTELTKITDTFTLLGRAGINKNAANDRFEEETARGADEEALEAVDRVIATEETLRERLVASTEIIIAANLAEAVAFVIKTSEEALEDAKAAAIESVENAANVSSKAISVSLEKGSIVEKFKAAAKIFTAAKDDNSKNKRNVDFSPVVLSLHTSTQRKSR